ncbi:hypothetical protein Ais01nite_28820 [Asanoa ishikariensis]|uniref:DUF3800 domain-containing protein n=1 Tax=Asanoa ishikariensis TaxID=137265 RepID=A0A1H3QQJ2_9ACTN|nr:hypothetical protein [Asanoa ishikariensis]GIF64847.1 hypothetical protein Ais01nite_28820 [Asanoa ishikariensis]SDZ14979.1 hypothetical protein SAMN05421684_3040 [Asanoa ishikariensis]
MAAEIREIACDESGYEGQQLVSSPTTVFAHGSVHLSWAAAAECMAELRARIKSPATEYKANHLLREKHRAVLVWLLGTGGPVHGHAYVQLVDKPRFLVRTLLDQLIDAPDRVDTLPVTAEPRWRRFLMAGNALLRTREPLDPTAADVLFQAIGDLRRTGVPPAADETLALLGKNRARADDFLDRRRTDPPAFAPVDLLAPAIVNAVAHWGPVRITHDFQSSLTPTRVAWLREAAPDLADLTLVDSNDDPRVQVADIVAGTVRVIAGRSDPELAALASGYVTATARTVAP